MPPGLLLRHAWVKTRLLWQAKPAAGG
jgi:hypothetical protein